MSLSNLLVDDEWETDSLEDTHRAAAWLRGEETSTEVPTESGIFPAAQRDTIPAPPSWINELEKELDEVA